MKFPDMVYNGKKECKGRYAVILLSFWNITICNDRSVSHNSINVLKINFYTF